MAVAYGADAVYLSGPGFGMRPAGRLPEEELAAAADWCHRSGVKLYVTCNTNPTESEMAALPAYLSFLGEIGADAIIAGDVGVLALSKRLLPDMPVHISTQTGVMNSVTAAALRDMGAARVILARELPMEELRRLCAHVPEDLEVEVFVHGSMCVSFSGRCLLSNYLASRDVNSGQCAQPCRWRYALSEERRPGEYFEITEEEGGSYILNSRDMCMLGHIGELYEAGVRSIKIEGRTKSAHYVATVTNAYRRAADAAMAGKGLDPVWLEEVEKVSHRPYSTGFYYGAPGQHTAGSEYYALCDFIAVVESCDTDCRAVLRQRNKFAPGETLELLCPGGAPPLSFVCGALEDEDGFPLRVANRPMQAVRTVLPVQAPPFSLLRRLRPEGERLRRRQQP